MKTDKFFRELGKAVNGFVELETSLGTIRRGKITGFTHKRIFFNGERVDMIVEIELNNDPGDRIPITEILKYSVI
jgi:hypothetical protein